MSACMTDDSPWCSPGACRTCDAARDAGSRPSAESRAVLAEADARGKHRGLELALGAEDPSYDALLRRVAALAKIPAAAGRLRQLKESAYEVRAAATRLSMELAELEDEEPAEGGVSRDRVREMAERALGEVPARSSCDGVREALSMLAALADGRARLA